jgi:hypothetical protein
MVCLLLALPAALAGCFQVTGGGEKLYNSLSGVRTVVVAPVANLSTSNDLDTLDVTNALASEFQQVEGIHVVPLGRVYQYLAANRMRSVGSPAEARALAAAFKADVTIVAAVTEYDPYDPPRMGLAMHMYSSTVLPAPDGSSGFDPISASRSAAPFPVTDDATNKPRDMIARIYSGRDTEVEALARLYAKRRSSDASPYAWRRFIVDQREFQRLCCYALIREMLGETGRKRERLGIKIESDHPR